MMDQGRDAGAESKEGRDRVKTRLAIMMGLVWGLMGAWWPLLTTSLADWGIDARGRGWIFATQAIAAVLTPALLGGIADRYCRADRLMAVIALIGSAILACLASGSVRGFPALFGTFLLYWMVMAPTLSLSNSITLRHLERPGEQFGGIRLWGTAGWMIAGWIVSLLLILSAGRATTPQVAFGTGSVLAFALALLAFTLPDTPPLARSTPAAAAAPQAVPRHPWDRAVLSFLLISLGVGLTTPFVYQVVPAYLPKLGLPRPWIAMAMSLAQIPEILGLAFLPLVIRRCGLKGVMGIGITSWVAYHAAMASHPTLGLALATVPLAGVAVSLFHISGPIYLDSAAPPDVRASAQGLYMLMTTGLGNLLGNLLAGEIVAASGGIGPVVFLAPMLLNLIMLFLFAARFVPGADPSAIAQSSQAPTATAPDHYALRRPALSNAQP
jgi:MFS family permease